MTMLWHGGSGVFDRVALHCYSNTIANFTSTDATVNTALQYLLWLWNDVDQTGWVYVTEANNFSAAPDPTCTAGNDYPLNNPGDTTGNGTALAQFEVTADAQFGANVGSLTIGTFLRAVYGYILETSDCGASTSGEVVIGSTFMAAYLHTLNPPA